MSVGTGRRGTAPLDDDEIALLRDELREMQWWVSLIIARRLDDEPWRDIRDELRVESKLRMTTAKFEMCRDWIAAAKLQVRLAETPVTFASAIGQISRRFEQHVVRYGELAAQVDPTSGRRVAKLAEIAGELGVDTDELQLVRLWFHDVRVHRIVGARPLVPAFD